MRSPVARLGGLWATGLEEVSHDPAVLDGRGRWAVVLPYEGQPTLLRFAAWSHAAPEGLERGSWPGPKGPWSTSMDEAAYVAAVEATRQAIAAGEVYQANICRVLSAAIDDDASMLALDALLAAGNPAPHAGVIAAPEVGIELATSSPELFLARDEDAIVSGPIKGTAPTAAQMLDKDAAENIMIVDLVRNDVSRVCETGSVTVPELLAMEEHPGLVHLVSRVRGRLRGDVGWPELLEATFPPGSVTGTPKIRARALIDELEPVSREVYCGAVGWVDADTGESSLAVAIRTFWKRNGRLCFGTGAGITWASDARAEWQETELKAARLIGLANGAAS